MIRFDNLWKEYQLDNELTFTALREVSGKIENGEYVAIMGPSGSGKSTLMHIVGLLDKPSRGKLLIDGRDVSGLSDNQISTLRNEVVGFVFQQFNLLNKLTVLENVLLPTIYYRRRFDFDIKERANYLLDRFGLSSKKDSYPNKISGGQQQRVAIARALINKPKLILADEPTGNLDTKTGDEILKLFGELNREDKITVVIVTHEMDVANKTRRMIKIKDGQIV